MVFINMKLKITETQLKRIKKHLSETISASDAYTDEDAMNSVLNGNRSVAFLLGPTIKKYYDDYIKDKPNVDLMVVNRDGEGIYGDGYILYSDINKAKKLHSIMMKHNGYLSDKSPEEAIENGEALEYHDEDIKAFTDRRYGLGSYDKAKGNG
jgi:hypothetical protein